MKHALIAVLGLTLAGAVLGDDPKPTAKAAATVNPNAAQSMGGSGNELHQSGAAQNKAEGARDLHNAEGANDHPKANSSANVQH